MAVTVANLITNLDTYIGDSSTDRVSQAERFQALTESVVWLQEELGNDTTNATYTLNYLDTVYAYKTTSAIADLLDGADLRRGQDDHVESFTRKSPRELAEEIGQGFGESSWAIERRDLNSYLIVNHGSKYPAYLICDFEATDSGGGTWEADTTNSDATNLTIDSNEFKQGAGSFNFDITVAQSGNNRATITNSTLDALDLSDYIDLASWVFEVYIPDVTNFSSITFYWGSDSSNYWSATATTDINGSAFIAGWNTIKINWADATKTSSPDVENIDYIRFDFNYTGSQADDTDFRIDYLRLVRPEKLTFHYTSWYVGQNSSGTDLTAFTATTDVPFFSGQYDQYKYAVAHKAASILFYGPLRLANEGGTQEVEAIKALRRAIKFIPSSRTPEVKSFKVRGVSFRRGVRRANIR